MPEHLRLDNVSVRYGSVNAVSGASVSLTSGDIGCLLGPSGCGKTSLLRAIGGFEPIAAGKYAPPSNVSVVELYISTLYLSSESNRSLAHVTTASKIEREDLWLLTLFTDCALSALETAACTVPSELVWSADTTLDYN